MELAHKDAVLRDMVQAYCNDQDVMNKCNSMEAMAVKVDAKRRYIMSALDVIDELKQLDSTIDVDSMGETDFIIAYGPPSPPAYIQRWTKTTFVCLVCFFGAAFVIMTFNNDVNVTDMFSEMLRLVMGYGPGGFTMLEVSYSIRPAVGIIGFFNHFAAIRLNTDPTPLEVEIRLYKDNASKTLIANDSRKESKADIT